MSSSPSPLPSAPEPAAAPARWPRGAWWAVAAGLTVALALLLLVPWEPWIPSGDIDRSYTQALHLAFAQGLRFGREVVFTLGPWGLLYAGYTPQTSSVCLAAWLLLAAAWGWGAWTLSRRLGAGPWLALAWSTLLVVSAGLPSVGSVDARLWALAPLLLLVRFGGEPRSPRAELVLAAAAGFSVLIKFSFAAAAGPVLLALAVDDLRRRRRFPLAAAVAAGAALAGWWLAGQRTSDLAAFVASSARLSADHGEAMALSSPTDGRDVALFLGTATAVLATAGAACWRRLRARAALPLLALAAAVFVLFKAGYVRHDAHEVTATCGLLLLGALLVPTAWSSFPGRWRWAAAIPFALAAALASSSLARHEGSGLTTHLAAELSWDRLAWAPRRLGGDEADRRYDRELARVRERYPVARVPGTFDVYPWDLDVLFANELPYQPRPMWQSLSVFSAELGALNARHLATAQAPQHVLFDLKTIDGRFPALDDGRSWPELLSRYDLADASGPFLRLERAASPRPVRFEPIATVSAALDRPVPVPSMASAPIWATVDVRLTWLGRLVKAFYKPPALVLAVRTAGGEGTFRLLPSVARGGFLLSPLVANRMDFAALASSGWRRELAGAEVRTLGVSPDLDAGDWTRACYQPEVTITFQRMEVAAQDLARVPGIREAESIRRLEAEASVVQAEAPPRLVRDRSGVSVLAVWPTTALRLPVQGRPTSVRVGFGVVARNRPGGPGAAIQFRVSMVAPDGRAVALWSRLLDPASQPADRGPQHTVLELPAVPAALLLEASRADGRPVDPGYWSELALE